MSSSEAHVVRYWRMEPSGADARYVFCHTDTVRRAEAGSRSSPTRLAPACSPSGAVFSPGCSRRLVGLRGLLYRRGACWRGVCSSIYFLRLSARTHRGAVSTRTHSLGEHAATSVPLSVCSFDWCLPADTLALRRLTRAASKAASWRRRVPSACRSTTAYRACRRVSWVLSVSEFRARATCVLHRNCFSRRAYVCSVGRCSRVRGRRVVRAAAVAERLDTVVRPAVCAPLAECQRAGCHVQPVRDAQKPAWLVGLRGGQRMARPAEENRPSRERAFCSNLSRLHGCPCLLLTRGAFARVAAVNSGHAALCIQHHRPDLADVLPRRHDARVGEFHGLVRSMHRSGSLRSECVLITHIPPVMTCILHAPPFCLMHHVLTPTCSGQSYMW